MKPLSPKTLAKKYAELGLSQARLDLLHDYFLCFSNLYGVISVGEAWNVFRHYEGINGLHKRTPRHVIDVPEWIECRIRRISMP